MVGVESIVCNTTETAIVGQGVALQYLEAELIRVRYDRICILLALVKGSIAAGHNRRAVRVVNVDGYRLSVVA